MANERKRTASASIPVGDPTSDAPGHSAPDNNDSNESDPHDRIAMRAYELYLSRGGRDGADFDDWLAAERELSGGRTTLQPGDRDE